MNLKKSISSPMIFFLLITGCAGPSVRYGSKPSAEITVNSSSLPLCADEIDKETTYELFFKLQRAEDCIAVEGSAAYPPGPFGGSPDSAVLHFIVEKPVDISPFPGKTGQIFTELGRNFDTAWETRSTVEICSSAEFPLRKLVPGVNYRVRLTTFRKRPADFTLSIKSSGPAEFITVPR